MNDVLLLFCTGLIGGLLASFGHKWSLERKIYTLECDVADLQEKMLSELKKRASLTAKLSHDEQKILAAVQEKIPVPQEPWWAKMGRT